MDIKTYFVLGVLLLRHLSLRRKTAIACALVAKPKVLILDEALNGLDPPSVERVLRALEEVRAEGTAIVLSTHVLDTLEKIATRIIMLKNGRIEHDCLPSDLNRIRNQF